MRSEADTAVAKECAAAVVLYSASLAATELSALFSISGRSWESSNWPSRGPRRVPRSGIEFASRLPPHESSEGHIEHLLEAVQPAFEAITSLLRQEDHWGWMAIKSDTTGWGGGVSVAAEQLKRVAQLGLSLQLSYAVFEDVER